VEKIPGELGNLPNLQVRDLSSNQFTSNIPPELGNLVSVNRLLLSHNQLSGSIPKTIGNLANLNELDLSFNGLTGSIPTELQGLTHLYRLDLSYNQLTGVVPTALAKAPISDLRLWGNLLDGNVLTSGEPVTKVQYQGVQFEFNSTYAESVWPEIGAAQPSSEGGPDWELRPEHVRFTFASQSQTGSFQAGGIGISGQPQILIYPTRTFSKMSEMAKGEIEGLQALLEARPAVPDQEIPLLPLINAAQVFHSQVKYLDIQNGRGVRFITQYSQDVSPITNQRIFYTFQGLTADGAYYVAAYFPVTASGLSDEPTTDDWEAFNAGYEAYLVETVNDLNGLQAHEFKPDLDSLDQVIQSLVVNGS
jgi:Leucine Rich Repeat (LRR) protein